MTDNILREFKRNVIEFLDELIEQFPHETDLVIGRIFIKDRITSEQLIHRFIQHVIPYKQHILDKNDTFFLQNSSELFGSSSLHKGTHLKKIWKSSQLDEEDRQIIWDYFKAFIMLCEKYSELKSQN